MDIYNLEAEAYEATVLRPVGTGILSLREETLESLQDLGGLRLDPGKGRIPMMLEAARPDLQLCCGSLLPYDADPGIVMSIMHLNPFPAGL